jgi:RNA polymerase sigma-70 factor (ECF subfamily)
VSGRGCYIRYGDENRVDIAINRERFAGSGRASFAVTEHLPIMIVTASNADAALARMVSGDDAAFAELFEAFNPKLERFFARQLGAGAHTQDLAQEVWVRTINLRRAPEKIRTPFRVQAFLFRVAKNLTIDFLRTRKQHAALDTLEEPQHPVTQVQDLSDPEELVAQAFAMLSDDFREVLTLQLELGYRLDEIAEMLDKSPDAIWARASRARIKLRRLVVELADQRGVSLREFSKEVRS